MQGQNINTKNNRINLIDLFLYLLSHWYWFLLCAALCLGYAYYRYAKQPFIYRSDATVMIPVVPKQRPVWVLIAI